MTETGQVICRLSADLLKWICHLDQLLQAGDSKYEEAAVAALSQLWGMRTPLDLVGTSIDVQRAQWNNRLGGTGAGADSFYEYLLKAYLLFGKSDHIPVALPLALCLLIFSGVMLERPTVRACVRDTSTEQAQTHLGGNGVA